MTDNRRRSVAVLCAALGAGVMPLAAQAADDLATLRAEVDDLKKQVSGGDWTRADSQLHLAGYGMVTYIDSKHIDSKQSGVNNSFGQVQFSPIFHYQYKDLVMLESELEIVAAQDGTTETAMEYLTVDLFLNDYMTLVAGKFLSPLGQFRQNMHPAWINKLASMPPGFHEKEGAVPQSEVGVELRGGIPLGAARANYAVYVGNGPELHSSGGEIEEIATEGFTADKDGKKVLGGRLGILPIAKLEIGVSGAAGKTSITNNGGAAVTGEPTRDYSATGADAAYQVADVNLRAEYMKQKAGAAPTSLYATEEAIWKTWYGQAAYVVPTTKIELVARYGNLDAPGIVMDKKQTALGINYLFAANVMAKLTYEVNKGKVAGTAADADRTLVQLAYGF